MSDASKYRNKALDGYTYNDLIEYGYDDILDIFSFFPDCECERKIW